MSALCCGGRARSPGSAPGRSTSAGRGLAQRLEQAVARGRRSWAAATSVRSSAAAQRDSARDLEDRRVGNYPAARQIALARHVLAPYREAPRARARRRRQLREAAQPLPRAARDRARTSADPRAPSNPRPPSARAPARAAARSAGRRSRSRYCTSSAAYSSCSRVSGRFDQSVRVWPLASVTSKQRLDQIRVADLRLESDAARGDLRVEHRRNHAPDVEIKRLEILARGVNDLARARRR